MTAAAAATMMKRSNMAILLGRYAPQHNRDRNRGVQVTGVTDWPIFAALVRLTSDLRQLAQFLFLFQAVVTADAAHDLPVAPIVEHPVHIFPA